MADFDTAADAIIEAIEMKAEALKTDNWTPVLAAPALLELAQAWAALRTAQ